MNVAINLSKEDIRTRRLGLNYVIEPHDGLIITFTPDALDELLRDRDALRDPLEGDVVAAVRSLAACDAALAVRDAAWYEREGSSLAEAREHRERLYAALYVATTKFYPKKEKEDV